MVEPYYTDTKPDIAIYNGDCRTIMGQLEPESVDSIVCDPPYELGFMGKGWDRSGIAYDVSVWSECLRVLKPGGHLLAFGGSRTYHRLACAIEDAGFEIRDQIQWLYGSGFPKSLDVSKAIDALAGAERAPGEAGPYADRRPNAPGESIFNGAGSPTSALVTFPVTDAAKQWRGWGTGLKPAHEPLVLARKPLIGTVAENVLQHGTGGLNIDGCRIDLQGQNKTTGGCSGTGALLGGGIVERVPEDNSIGRWPANVIHDGSNEVLAGFPAEAGGDSRLTKPTYDKGIWGNAKSVQSAALYQDSGSAARFFYCAKADQQDREDGLEEAAARFAPTMGSGIGVKEHDPQTATPKRNFHPTVKPTELMRYLCRLATPPGGLVLDPFCGSGSTGKAARAEEFRFIGIEISEEYCALAAARCEIKQRSLFAQ